MATFDEIQEAFFFVSSDEYGMNRAHLCLDNGEIYYKSEIGGLDELDEDTFDCDHYIGSAEGHGYPDLQVGDEVKPRPFLGVEIYYVQVANSFDPLEM
jgi:hypothetical protein